MPAREGDAGAKVIRAHVRARLLGLQLLTVDAYIDVAPPSARAPEGNGRSWVVPRRDGRPDGEQLGRATLLLEEGGLRLCEAEALRRRLTPD